MSDAFTCARPYARAVFAVAQATKQEEKWSKALMQSTKIATDPKVIALLANAAISHSQQVQLFATDAFPAFQRFVKELVLAGRIGIFSAISELYHQLWADAAGVVHVTMTVAQPVAPDQQQRLVNALHRRFKRQIELTTIVDASLLGGAIVEANGVVINGSAQGKLARLKDKLAFSTF